MVIGSQQIDTGYFSSDFVINKNTGGGIGGIPPGSIQLFVFETYITDAGNDVDGLDLNWVSASLKP